MKNTALFYPRTHLDTRGTSVVGNAGGIVLTETIRTAGFDRLLSEALTPWRKPFAVHDPGKILLDLAVTLALGGDAAADIGLLRSAPGVYGQVASDATVSRLITALAKDPEHACAQINTARAVARANVWAGAGEHSAAHDTGPSNPLVVDVDATLLTAHSVKENAAPTFKRGFGFHPLTVFADHGADGTGEPLAVMLRPGNAGSNTATDHIQVIGEALTQLPSHKPGVSPGRGVLIRIDGAGSTHKLIDWLTGQNLSYSLGFTLPFDTPDLYSTVPETEWAPALDADQNLRDGADVTELTNLLDLGGWPDGMRVIVRRERPHPGAQLRFEDVDGYRLTAFATNTETGDLAELELRHRRRARIEDRIRVGKDTGLRNLPFHSFGQNQIWCHIVQLALDVTAWAQTLALHGHDARRWEAKRLRYRLFTAAATIARTGRRVIIHLNGKHPWAGLILSAIHRLRALPAPAPG